MIQIPFHPRHTDSIEAGKKRFTIRYDFSHRLQPGDIVQLVDENREAITEAEIILAAKSPGYYIAHWRFDGHCEYQNWIELKNELDEYYPDADVQATDDLTVIGWDPEV